MKFISVKSLLIFVLSTSFTVFSLAKETPKSSEKMSTPASAASSASRENLEEGLNCNFIYPIEQAFLNQHVLGMAMDDKLRDRVVEQYIKKLDATKIYFTQSDVDQIKGLLSKILDQVKNHDCVSLLEVQKLFIKRAQDRADFAKKTLDSKFKVDYNVEFEFDPDKRPYSKTQDEINEFMRKYLHFQVSNYLATDMKMDEAKSTVVKNYERLVKRITEKKTADIYADYLDCFARSLDPHSNFFSHDVEEDFRIQMSLSLEGIGATLSSQDGFTVVEQLVPGGAAARSGLVQPTDKIIAVGQGETGKLENVVEWDLRDVVAKIRGKKGTKVRLSLLRKNGDKKDRLEIVLVRDKVKLEDEAAAIHYIDKDINGTKKKLAVLDLPSFYAGEGRSSATDVKKLIAEAAQKKVDGIVLDLSTNGGGSLEDAVRLGGLFFKTGNVVKQTGRDETHSELALDDKDPTVDWNGPLVVLTSRISASASEIVSGALKDYKRAIIVGGDHTFGKGSVQQVVPIPQKLGALKVTIGMFYTPGGFSTQHRGVEGDIVLPSAWSTEDVGEKSLDYSLPPKKIASFISDDAYVKTGIGSWKPIESSWITLLRERSKQRVEKSEDYKKIIAEIKKAEARGKVIKLSEVTKEKGEKEKKDKSKKFAPKDEKIKEYLGRADIKEAVDVLADLVVVSNSEKLAPLTSEVPKKTTTVEK